ncbi:hypothetical protein FKM82_016275 [Ascaphus truei]
MATHFSANQYQSAFNSNNLQNWNVPKPYKERPSAQEGYTQFIANDRGHLLPGAPRSKTNPWGTFMGTWDMPPKIPPAKLSLTSRSAAASKCLTDWIQDSRPLINACNGLRPHITGKSEHGQILRASKALEDVSGTFGSMPPATESAENPEETKVTNGTSQKSSRCAGQEKHRHPPEKVVNDNPPVSPAGSQRKSDKRDLGTPKGILKKEELERERAPGGPEMCSRCTPHSEDKAKEAP